MSLPSGKHALMESIFRDISLGILDGGPCEKCGAKANGSCCGCTEEVVYREKLAPYIQTLGADALTEAIAVGALKRRIAEDQKELEKRQKKLELLLSPEYEAMQKKQAEVTAYFNNIKED